MKTEKVWQGDGFVDLPVKLDWRKVPRTEDAGSWSPLYEATDTETGEVCGSAVRTGRTGSDDYPWDWHVEPLKKGVRYPNGAPVRTSGAADTLRSAKDQAGQAARMTR